MLTIHEQARLAYIANRPDAAALQALADQDHLPDAVDDVLALLADAESALADPDVPAAERVAGATERLRLVREALEALLDPRN